MHTQYKLSQDKTQNMLDPVQMENYKYLNIRYRTKYKSTDLCFNTAIKLQKKTKHKQCFNIRRFGKTKTIAQTMF